MRSRHCINAQSVAANTSTDTPTHTQAVPQQVMDKDGVGRYSTVLDGLQWVSNHVALNGVASAVVVMSLAGNRSASVNEAINIIGEVRKYGDDRLLLQCTCSWHDTFTRWNRD